VRNPLHFFKDLLEQPIWVPIWVGFMMAVNMGSLAFWAEPLAKAILGIFLLSSMLMMGLYARFGYEKILGLGHILWIPVLAWVLLALPGTDGAFRVYLLAWILTTVTSLVMDAVDVWQYASRRRADARSVLT